MTVFTKLLYKYGAPVVIHSDTGENHTKALVQPVMDRKSTKKWEEITRLGERDTSRYYFFGPPDITIAKGMYVDYDGRLYDVIRAERYRVGGKASHWEAVLELREEIYDG